MNGCITALLTPFNGRYEVDIQGFELLIDFQVKNGVNKIVVAGTTGEGPTLSSEEWKRLIEVAIESKATIVANVGFNSTSKTLEYTEEAYKLGCRNMLLVDPYYNAPSSLELRKEYYEPVAENYKDCRMIPYVIPSRTGTQLNPADLAMIHSLYPNVDSIKDATGSDEYSKEVRKLCGGSFHILSGDDERTFSMMTNENIVANGVISVVSNLVPKAMQHMITYLMNGDIERAKVIDEKLRPLFQIVTVKTEEEMNGFKVPLKFRNPVPFKTLALLLGIPSGPCRKPLGKVSRFALKKIVDAARFTFENSPELFEPIEKMFDVKVERRLCDPRFLEGLSYE